MKTDTFYQLYKQQIKVLNYGQYQSNNFQFKKYL